MWTANIDVIDGERHTSTVSINLPTATTYADAAEVAGALASLVLALTEGRVTKVSVTNNALPLPAGNPAAGAEAGDVEIKGVFNFIASGTAGEYAYRISIPALKAAMKEAKTDKLDTSQAAVANFATQMVSGVTAPTSTNVIGPVDSRAYDIVQYISAVESYGKKRRPLALEPNPLP